METLLQAKGLEKHFGTGEARVPVIRGLDLECRAGTFTAVMGASGSGKSSLLYLLGTLDKACNGELLFKQQRVDQLSESATAPLRRDHMGFVFQSYNLVPNLSLLGNLLAAGYLGDHSRGEVRDRAMSLLKLVGIDHLAKRMPARVSGGEQQRCAIARALINEPEILFADEPTGALDSAATEKVLDIFSSLHQTGQTIVMVTHELKAACRGQRVLYMRDGRIEGAFHFPDQEHSQADREQLLFDWLSERGW